MTVKATWKGQVLHRKLRDERRKGAGACPEYKARRYGHEALYIPTLKKGVMTAPVLWSLTI